MVMAGHKSATMILIRRMFLRRDVKAFIVVHRHAGHHLEKMLTEVVPAVVEFEVAVPRLRPAGW
jgi:hypothetical protein